jgi:phage shock protein A/DNA-binding XRE family transcriptional regulator
VAYLLRMSDEIRDWLADLGGSDPPAAMLVGQALTALIGEGDRLGPPLVVPLARATRLAELSEALDRSYQDRLDRLQLVRRHVADAATLAREMQIQITDLELLETRLADQRRQALGADDPATAERVAGELAAAQDQLAELRPLLPGVTGAERQLTEQSQLMTAEASAFRTRKEVLKARYTAALAEQTVSDARIALGQADGAPSGAGDAQGDAAADRLQQVTREIEEEVAREDPADGLLELRPDTPGDGDDIRIIFAVEPPGTALLIAVLEGRHAVQDRRREAIEASAVLLRRARAGQAPEAAAHAFDDKAAFLDALLPGHASEIEAGAAALVARSRARTLAEQRTRLGLTQAQVAQRMGVRQERVSAIERADPGSTEVRTLASYVEALGGRLEVIADLGDERIQLR